MEVFREKLGPLPVWAWLALITAAGLGWWLVSRRKANANTATGSTTADVPQSVIQTTVNLPPEPMEQDRDRDRDRKARKHTPTDRQRAEAEEDKESDRTEARERGARSRSRNPEDREPHRPYHPPHGRAPTNHNPQRQAA